MFVRPWRKHALSNKKRKRGRPGPRGSWQGHLERKMARRGSRLPWKSTHWLTWLTILGYLATSISVDGSNAIYSEYHTLLSPLRALLARQASPLSHVDVVRLDHENQSFA